MNLFFRYRINTVFISAAFLFCSVQGFAGFKYHQQVNGGVSIHLNFSKAQKFPGIKLYAGYSIMGVNSANVIVNYGAALSLYSNTIGANLNPLERDLQIDFIHSFSAGYASKKEVAYYKNYRTIHSGDYYTVSTKKQNMGLLTSNFILNNHKRNQIVGTLSATFGEVSLYYANDGAAPFTFLPLADNFDRYWTGSGGVFVHNKKRNVMEASFDQFTGYNTLLYELSNILGINVPLYNDEDDEKNKHRNTNYNTSAYLLKVFLDDNYTIDAGMLGSLITEKGKHFGLQDLIHMSLGMSLHPNNDDDKIFVGGSYNYMQHVK